MFVEVLLQPSAVELRGIEHAPLGESKVAQLPELGEGLSMTLYESAAPVLSTDCSFELIKGHAPPRRRLQATSDTR